MKLLIVEDNPAVRRILKTVVSKIADEILECEDADESVSIYRTEHPDYVLMDINLGKTNGIDATRKINDFDHNAKVIIVTNYDEFDLRQAAEEVEQSDLSGKKI